MSFRFCDAFDSDDTPLVVYDVMAPSIDPMRLPKRSTFIEQLNICESPIEQVMLAMLLAVAGKSRAIIEVLPQYWIGPYRVDFAVVFGKGGRVVVECDGHDFHERTKEQAARDKQRDRDLALRGWTVLRFTGSEVWNDPASCAVQIADLVDFRLLKKPFRGEA